MLPVNTLLLTMTRLQALSAECLHLLTKHLDGSFHACSSCLVCNGYGHHQFCFAYPLLISIADNVQVLKSIRTLSALSC